MAEYIYTRETLTSPSGVWDIDNPNRVDGEGKQIWLAHEVQTALPGKVFTMHCNGSEAKFIFSAAITSAEETSLTNTVNAHKNNT